MKSLYIIFIWSLSEDSPTIILFSFWWCYWRRAIQVSRKFISLMTMNIISANQCHTKLQTCSIEHPLNFVFKIGHAEATWTFFQCTRVSFKDGILCAYWLSGKVFGSRPWHMDLAVLGPFAVTESQIFSHPTRPNLVNKCFIIWPIWRQICLKF